MLKVIIIIPSYNEENTIQKTVSALKCLSSELLSYKVEMLVYIVNDGSTDKTQELAIASEADQVIRHPSNMGLGAAVRTGLRRAFVDGGDIVVKFDADLQHNPVDVINIIQPILNDEADVVYGNRFDKISYRMPFLRRIGNIIFTRLMRWLTGWPLQDSQPGIFAVNRSYLNDFYLPGDYNYTQQILIDAYHKGLRFAQVSVSFSKRRTGKSFVSLNYPFRVLPQIIQVLVGVKPLKIFGTMGFIFIVTGAIVAIFNIFSWLNGHSPKPIQNVNLVLGLGLFGLQTLFFGLLADLIVRHQKQL